MQVRKTQVRICNGGKRKYSNLKEYFEEFTISQSCIFSRSAVSRSRPVHMYRTRPVLYTRNLTHAQKGLGSKIAGATLSSDSLRQTVYTQSTSVYQAAKLVAALLRVARVTAGLAESNGSLPPGL